MNQLKTNYQHVGESTMITYNYKWFEKDLDELRSTYHFNDEFWHLLETYCNDNGYALIKAED